jgi:hypothetical protein
MSQQDTEVHSTSPTTPEAANTIADLTEGGEAFSEPSGTVAEARRQGAEISEDTSGLEDAAARQDRLEQARQTMWETSQHSGGVEELGVQEEETARIADHLVFPGAGMRELRERAKVDPAVEGIGPDTGEPSPTDNPDRFPPAEWPPKDEGQG